MAKAPTTDGEKNQKQLEAALSGALNRTGDWLKFAETKNAALLTFSSAWLIAMSNLRLGANPPEANVAVALNWASLFILASAFAAIFALVPQIPIWPGKPKKAHRNLLYYGQIEGKDGQWLLSEMQATYLTLPASTYSDPYLLDLADQVADLSRVAVRKFRLFAIGASCVGAALVAFAISLWGPKFGPWVQAVYSCLA